MTNLDQLIAEDATTPVYQCFRCKKVEELTQVEETLEQLARDFPGVDPKDCDRYCEACYQALMSEVNN